MVDLLDDEELINEYALACNVDVQDMDRALCHDWLARQQYLAWVQQRAEDRYDAMQDRRFEGYAEQ